MDRTGDYGSQFYGIGACMVLAGLLVVVVSATSLDLRYGVQQDTQQPEAAPEQDAAPEQEVVAPEQPDAAHDRHGDVVREPIAEE